jgi:hypothetical protein
VAQESFAGWPNNGQVRAVFLHEPDEVQLIANYQLREPASGMQITRAQVSVLKGAWLRQEAEKYGVPVVAARPWETVFERVVEAVGS